MAYEKTATKLDPWMIVDHVASDFDELSPVQKRDRLMLHNKMAMAYCDNIVLALYVLDKCVESRYAYKGVYVLETPGHVLMMSSFADMVPELYARSIVALHLCQLIYRFTAATRFELSDASTKQLRVNSWGRSLVDAQLRENGKDIAPLERLINGVFDSNALEYGEIISLLKTPVNAKSGLRLSKLHQKVPIKLVQ